jgi:hypothetical protein
MNGADSKRTRIPWYWSEDRSTWPAVFRELKAPRPERRSEPEGLAEVFRKSAVLRHDYKLMQELRRMVERDRERRRRRRRRVVLGAGLFLSALLGLALFARDRELSVRAGGARSEERRTAETPAQVARPLEHRAGQFEEAHKRGR